MRDCDWIEWFVSAMFIVVIGLLIVVIWFKK